MSKKAKTRESVEFSNDTDDENSSSDDSQTTRKSSDPSQQQQSFKFVLPVDGVKQSSSEEDKNLIRRLQNELEKQKINIRGLEGDLKAEVEKQGEVLKLIQELVQRMAKIGTAMIGSILKSAMDFSEYIEERCPGAGKFFLEFYKRALDQEVKDLELFLSNRRQLADVAANPNGELARVGRGLPEDARNALKIERVDIAKSITDRHAVLLEKEKTDYIAKVEEDAEHEAAEISKQLADGEFAVRLQQKDEPNPQAYIKRVQEWMEQQCVQNGAHYKPKYGKDDIDAVNTHKAAWEFTKGYRLAMMDADVKAQKELAKSNGASNVVALGIKASWKRALEWYRSLVKDENLSEGIRKNAQDMLLAAGELVESEV